MSDLCCSDADGQVRPPVRRGWWAGAEIEGLSGHRLTVDLKIEMSAVRVVSSVGPELG
jgi:hypothetical protein